MRHPAAFKKSASPDVSKAVGPLLKAYQEEIDRLTSRAKAGEAAFLDVYQKLYEAPNPAPALSAGLVRKSMLQDVVQPLKPVHNNKVAKTTLLIVLVCYNRRLHMSQP